MRPCLVILIVLALVACSQKAEEEAAADSSTLRALYVTSGVEAEVNNGGFNQYYWNTSGQLADEAVAAFEFFSAHQHAALVREANRIRAAEKAEIEKFEDMGTIEAFSESYEVSKLGPLDEHFYELDENLSALRIARVRAEPSLFIAD